MSDRIRRPTIAPEDDPSIPVLTERLTLPVPGGNPAGPAATDAVVESMVFPNAAPALTPHPVATGLSVPNPTLPSFELPPAPAAITAPLASPVAKAGAQAVAQPVALTVPPWSTAAWLAPTATAPSPSGSFVVPISAPAPIAALDAATIRNAVLDELATRLPREIESLMRKQLAGSIEAAVQAASTDLAAHVRNAAAQSLQSLVEQAVKAEIARLRLPPPK
jgi:hypothetical protein